MSLWLLNESAVHVPSERQQQRKPAKRNEEKPNGKVLFIEVFFFFIPASTFDNDSMLGVGNGNVRQVWRIVNLSVCMKQCSRVPAITGVQWCIAYSTLICIDDSASHLSITERSCPLFFVIFTSFESFGFSTLNGCVATPFTIFRRPKREVIIFLGKAKVSHEF